MIKVGVVGLGFVGLNLYKYFKQEETLKTFGYDIDDSKSPNSFEETTNSDYIFLCLPTPYREGQKGYDLSCIKDTLKKIPDNKIVIIKSTVLPGTTEKLQSDYPNLKLGFIPEFLTERYAWEDTLHPDTSIFGYTQQSHSIANDVLKILPEASFERIIPVTEAELVKLARNNYFVNKIVFMNMIYDLCIASGIDYEVVKDCLASDRRIRKSHMDIFHQGGRGGGGTCFTKDTPAFRDWAAEVGGRAFDFIDHYTRINQELLKETGKDTGRQYG